MLLGIARRIASCLYPWLRATNTKHAPEHKVRQRGALCDARAEIPRPRLNSFDLDAGRAQDRRHHFRALLLPSRLLKAVRPSPRRSTHPSQSQSRLTLT
jgi:hypothetical protein